MPYLAATQDPNDPKILDEAVQAEAARVQAELAAIEALGDEGACRICKSPDVTDEHTPSTLVVKIHHRWFLMTCRASRGAAGRLSTFHGMKLKSSGVKSSGGSTIGTSNQPGARARGSSTSSGSMVSVPSLAKNTAICSWAASEIRRKAATFVLIMKGCGFFGSIRFSEAKSCEAKSWR